MPEKENSDSGQRPEVEVYAFCGYLFWKKLNQGNSIIKCELNINQNKKNEKK